MLPTKYTKMNFFLTLQYLFVLSTLSKKGQQINNNKYFNYIITEIICLGDNPYFH